MASRSAACAARPSRNRKNPMALTIIGAPARREPERTTFDRCHAIVKPPRLTEIRLGRVTVEDEPRFVLEVNQPGGHKWHCPADEATVKPERYDAFPDLGSSGCESIR